jgi:hypothetical protein
MNLGSKKDLRVCRVGLRWSCNTFFSLPIKVFFPKLTINVTGERERGNKHTWRAEYNKELYATFGKDESLLKN